MGNIFNEYPYRNFSDLNLDYILKKLSEMDSRLAEYVDQSTISFHDPITWDITDQYTVNTMVVDSDGTAYLSVQPVPAGVDIDNTKYWQPIFNYDDNINKVRATIAANERDKTTASNPRSVGDLVYLNGILYKVTVPMTAGTMYIVGTNCVEYTVSDRIQDVQSLIAGETEAREATDEQLQKNIDAEALSRGSADNQLQKNIDAEALSRETADNQLQKNIDAEALARTNADTALSERIDNLEVTGDTFWTNKKVVVYGDSLTHYTVSYWASLQALVPSMTLTKRAVDGSTLHGTLPIIKAATDLNEFDIIVIAFGTNEWQEGRPLATMCADYESCATYLKTNYPAKKIIFIAPPYSYNPNVAAPIQAYSNLIENVVKNYGITCVNFYNTSGCTTGNYSTLMLPSESDPSIFVHPSAAFCGILGRILYDYNQIQSGTEGCWFTLYSGGSGTLKAHISPSGLCSIIETGILTFSELYERALPNWIKWREKPTGICYNATKNEVSWMTISDGNVLGFGATGWNSVDSIVGFNLSFRLSN